MNNHAWNVYNYAFEIVLPLGGRGGALLNGVGGATLFGAKIEESVLEGGGGKKWSSLTCVEWPLVIIGGGALRVGVNGAKLFDSEMGGSLLVDVCISIVGGGGGRMSSLVLKGDVSKSKLLIPELVDSTTTSSTIVGGNKSSFVWKESMESWCFASSVV